VPASEDWEAMARDWRPKAEPDTPSRPPQPAEDRAMVVEAQRLLTALGYAPGPIDGIAGRRTRAAVRAFQAANGLPADGRITDPLLQRMRQRLVLR